VVLCASFRDCLICTTNFIFTPYHRNACLLRAISSAEPLVALSAGAQAARESIDADPNYDRGYLVLSKLLLDGVCAHSLRTPHACQSCARIPDDYMPCKLHIIFQATMHMPSSNHACTIKQSCMYLQAIMHVLATKGTLAGSVHAPCVWFYAPWLEVMALARRAPSAWRETCMNARTRASGACCCLMYTHMSECCRARKFPKPIFTWHTYSRCAAQRAAAQCPRSPSLPPHLQTAPRPGRCISRSKADMLGPRRAPSCLTDVHWMVAGHGPARGSPDASP
jgi:hypothetical protein